MAQLLMSERADWLRHRLLKGRPPLGDRLAYGAAHLAVVLMQRGRMRWKWIGRRR